MVRNLKLLPVLLIIFQSCDLLDVVEFEEPNRYKGCCSIAAVEDTVAGNLGLAHPQHQQQHTNWPTVGNEGCWTMPACVSSARRWSAFRGARLRSVLA